ncbi:hypothetical protein J6590_010186 [Homalodisca vitripennis]|nr:hypothetical protein J6590_010186 [Homalodisca vitripennis]
MAICSLLAIKGNKTSLDVGVVDVLWSIRFEKGGKMCQFKFLKTNIQLFFVAEGDPTCPNCVSHHHPHQHHSTKHHRRQDKPPTLPSQQSLRLEAIKTQILSKLGLSAKPNITLTVSRKVVQDTIERAEAVEGVEEETAPPTTRVPQEVSEPDDFYGRTREIITFAEPGRYDSHWGRGCDIEMGAVLGENGRELGVTAVIGGLHEVPIAEKELEGDRV